jgi:hypothetical protein
MNSGRAVAGSQLGIISRAYGTTKFMPAQAGQACSGQEKQNGKDRQYGY